MSLDDGDPCTRDECNPSLGVLHLPVQGLDRDGDGVGECMDACPGTAANAAVEQLNIMLKYATGLEFGEDA